MITRIVFICAIFACAVLPARATECETRATIDWLLSRFKTRDTPFSFAESLAHLANPRSRESAEYIGSQLKELADRVPPSATPVQIKDAHAVDYNDKIDRYQCEATMVPDPETYPNVLMLVLLAQTLSNQQNQTSLLLAALIDEGNLPKVQQVFGLLRASYAPIVAKATEPHTMRYTVQNTESGKLIEILESN
ncbi:hypothetical protein [Hyphomicrobium sp. 99]|uniref:hypothetical protein n=1 Tax=Hyphomicrobium sp. 99 TaxID=1163419 RepID=UPI0005F852BC|nr:hypothetical protein [Hyphomicrobium sp. 99]